MSNEVEIVGSGDTPPNLVESYYFSSIVYSAQKPEFRETALVVSNDYLGQIKARGTHNTYNYMSSNFHNDPRVKEICDFIVSMSDEILMKQGYNMDVYESVVIEMWCQEHLRHSDMNKHLHGLGSQISGFYFLESPQNCPVPVIHDPRPTKQIIGLIENNPNQMSQASNALTFEPREGSFIFTNSWLEHSFTKNGSDKPFKFIHFNVSVRPRIVPKNGNAVVV